MKRATVILAAMSIVASCASPLTWTPEERELIQKDSTCMRVLTIADPQDSLVLRQPCAGLSKEDIADGLYQTLADKMLATVTSPEQDGVGIAGPQVGILRRVVAVMRYDKDGYPFEVYPNIRITETRGEKEPGPEGCLSVPDMRGDVDRYQDITISYTDPVTLTDTTETVQGYTAVIFQHECDHLDGILYIDRL